MIQKTSQELEAANSGNDHADGYDEEAGAI